MTICSFLKRAGWGGALALTALLGTAGASSAANYTVLNTGSAGANTLRGAIAAAQAGSDPSDTITFAPSVTGTISLGGTELAISKNLTIMGPGANVLTLDAGGQSRVFDITSGTVAISGLTISNGYDNGNEGGGLFSNALLTVTACTFSNNTASDYGGGIYNSFSGALTVIGSTFSGNGSFAGGGIYSRGIATVMNSTFSGNSGSFGGGGYCNEQGAALTLSNSTFSGNSNGGGGGSGIYDNGGTISLAATLFVGNTNVDITNYGTLTSGGSNLMGDGDGNGVTNGVNHDQTGVSAADAKLGPLADNGGPTLTCALLTGSPAIDGDYSSNATTDQRGFGRPVGVRNDIGAYEYGAAALTVHAPVTLIVTNNLDDGSAGSLRSVLALTGPGDTITFDPGVTGTIGLNGTELAISQDLTIVGPGAGVLAIDAGGQSRVFDILAGAVHISGLTIHNGNVPSNGGGGIKNVGTLTVTGCVLSGNSADHGGGICNEAGGTVTLTGDTFTANTSSFYGGGLANGYSNEAAATASITNCTFSGNNGGDYGGGLLNLNTNTTTVTNCTFSGNTATDGGGLYNDSQASDVTVTASLFVGNTSDLTGGISVTSGGSNLLGDADGNGFVNGINHDQTGISASAAMLGPLADNGGPTPTIALLPGSPAIDADYSSSEATDQRGFTRPDGVRNDIGAYEGVGTALVTLTSITVTQAASSVTVGATDQFTATAHFSDSSTSDVTSSAAWASDDTAKATIDSTGLATGVAAGSANITATYNGTASAPVALTVTAAITPATLGDYILWNNANGRVSVWNMSDPNPVATCHLYGPFPGWTAKTIAEGADGHARILWTNTDGRVSLWDLTDSDPANDCHIYGPYAGWSAKTLAIGSNNAPRILWSKTDGTMSLWSVNSTGGFTYNEYGPYPGWTAKTLAVGSDNHPHILWDNTSGQNSLWDVDTTGAFIYHYAGPFAGWSAKALSVGANSTVHLLWQNTNGVNSLWNVNSSATSFAFSYNYYGPYAGWTPAALADGQDGQTRVLWNNVSGQVSLWSLNSATAAFTYHYYGPYAGWTATAVAAH